MLPNDVAFFGVTLAGALVMLIEWKRRRMRNARRVNRGLRGYVSGKSPKAPADTQELTAA